MYCLQRLEVFPARRRGEEEPSPARGENGKCAVVDAVPRSIPPAAAVGLDAESLRPAWCSARRYANGSFYDFPHLLLPRLHPRHAPAPLLSSLFSFSVTGVEKARRRTARHLGAADLPLADS